MVETSDHPVLPPGSLPLLFNTSGITCGTAPLLYWSAATSFIHLVKKLCTFILNDAVRENTCASPVQPKRSSRCGQSVGTSKKLPFCPHWILCCSWLIIGFDDVKLPVGVISEYNATAVTSPGLIISSA